MNLDKHDLFRNAAPGFVFLIVILSFYAVTENLEALDKGQATLLMLVAGFPLGFIFHSLYRIVFHVGFGEQGSIDRQEASLVGPEVEGSDRDKAHHVLFELYKPEHQNWKERVDFLYSYVHALGASALAIVFALAFIFTIKYPLVCTCCCRSHPSIPLRVFLTGVFWGVVWIIFLWGREQVKDTCRISTNTFWRLKTG